jgi:hypothetical protein
MHIESDFDQVSISWEAGEQEPGLSGCWQQCWPLADNCCVFTKLAGDAAGLRCIETYLWQLHAVTDCMHTCCCCCCCCCWCCCGLQVIDFTMGYVMDRRLGNTGGLGGAFGLLYAIGCPFPYPEGHPWQSSWQQTVRRSRSSSSRQPCRFWQCSQYWKDRFVTTVVFRYYPSLVRADSCR